MTSGEQMVWAAEFVRARAAGTGTALAIRLAGTAVHVLRIELERAPDLGEVDRLLLDDMLSNSEDR